MLAKGIINGIGTPLERVVEWVVSNKTVTRSQLGRDVGVGDLTLLATPTLVNGACYKTEAI